MGTLWLGSSSSEARSLAAAGESMRLCFRNCSNQTIFLCWVDQGGDLYHFRPLKPFPSSLDDNDIVTKQDHVETTQTGHAFVLLAAPSADEAKLKHSPARKLVGAYRAERKSIEYENESDDKKELKIGDSIQFITVYDSIPTRGLKDCNPCMLCFPRLPHMNGDHDELLSRKIVQDEDADDGTSWKLSIRLARVDPTPIDSAEKCYQPLSLHPDWTVYAEENWHGDNVEIQKHFQNDLQCALNCLPEEARKRLCKATPFWLNRTMRYGPAACPVKGRGMCFHPDSSWLIENGMSPKKQHGVELYQAEDYISDREYWCPGGLLIHELSHAYHYICLPDGYDNAEILACYKAAMQDGLYECVPVHGPQGPMAKAYACQDAMEYFAELSTAFLGGTDEKTEFNKWYPFNRKQVKDHDPRAYDLLKRLWKVQDD